MNHEHIKTRMVKAATKVNPTRIVGAWWAPSANPSVAGSEHIEAPREPYDGKELCPFEGRPGAMDFKKYPSGGRKV